MNLRRSLKKWVYGSCPGFAGSFPYFGTRIYFPKRSQSFIGACDQGIWENDLIQVIRSLVRPRTSYFDVGANIGLTSIPILAACSDCAVVSFEASPDVLLFLQRTHDAAGYGDRWQIVPKAVGAETGTGQFFTASPELSLYNGLRDTRRVSMTRAVTVPITTLDAEWEKLDRPKVSVIKIDIEGAELLALQGASQCVEREHPSIVLEWNATNLVPYEIRPETILSFAKDRHYELFSLPNLISISDATMLALQMIRTESFLMVPTSQNGFGK